MTPLRQRFVDDLRLRNYSRRTIDTYVGRVVAFARHFDRSPELLGPEEVRAFQLHLLERRVSWSTFNQTACALRFLFRTTLGRPEVLPHIPYGKKPRSLPSVLSQEEVVRLLDAAAGRERVLLQVAYGCGLRLEELLHLRVGDIDSSRMIVHVRLGKGAKDRLVPLAPRLLLELRARPASQDDDAGRAGVLAALRAARAAEGLRQDSPLRRCASISCPFGDAISEAGFHSSIHHGIGVS
jgi:site-specific recombinase XerD